MGVRLALFLLLCAGVRAQSGDPLTVSGKAQYFARRVVSPLGLVGSAFGAGIGQLRGEPPEWGGGMAGYGRRYASSRGYAGVQNLFAFTLDSTLRLDPRYEPSRRAGGWNRTRDAIVHSLVIRKDEGGRTLDWGLAGGQVGAALLSNSWHPDHCNAAHDAFARAGLGVSYRVLANIAVEFWPDVRRRLFRRRSSTGSAAPTAPPRSR